MFGGQQQGGQFGQQGGGYMGFQRNAMDIFRTEAPRSLQDAMVFLQPAAVMTCAAILGVAVFSDAGTSGRVDSPRFKAGSKIDGFLSSPFQSSKTTWVKGEGTSGGGGGGASFTMPKSQDYYSGSGHSPQVDAARAALGRARSEESAAKKAEMKAREVEVSAVRQASLAQEKATLAKKEAQAASALAKKRTAEVATAESDLNKAEAQVASAEAAAAEARAKAAVERAASKAAIAKDQEERAKALY